MDKKRDKRVIDFQKAREQKHADKRRLRRRLILVLAVIAALFIGLLAHQVLQVVDPGRDFWSNFGSSAQAGEGTQS